MTTRFDTRLAVEQKELFEQARTIAGYRSLTEFVIEAANRLANEIIEKHNSILASRKDQQIFFDSLVHPPKPNKALKKAAEKYKNSL